MKVVVPALILLFLLPCGLAYSGQRFVTRATDDVEEGTLRRVLQASCDDPGDDFIVFAKTHLPEIRIVLNAPLVIPIDCQGRVTLQGSSQAESLLDASQLTGGGKEPGDSCTLHVYADGHTIENFTFVGHTLGAGVCLFGRNNTVQKNRFGANRHGVVIADVFTGQYPQMDGSGNKVLKNQIEYSEGDGIFVHAGGAEISGNKIRHSGGKGLFLKGDGFQITGNEVTENGADGVWIRGSNIGMSRNDILANGGCPAEGAFASDKHECLFGGAEGGAGVLIESGSKDILIGESSFDEGRNFIRYNQGGGVVVLGDASTDGHTISHNIISKNYGSGPNLDLKGDGVTENDPGDADQGPNRLLNYIDYVQTFPLVPDPYGGFRYWSWGVARSGDSVELYLVSGEDIQRGKSHGGGDNFVGESVVEGKTFSLKSPFVADEGWTTALSFDGGGNTSEFSLSFAFGPDEDLDGIVDADETGDGAELEGSFPDLTDSDNDGLPDSVEDLNRNGEWDMDQGETAAYLADSDNDGVSDWHETHGDGRYDPLIDTDTLNPDTDKDGIPDGVEDKNGNGIWEAHLGETDPRFTDSDGDGHSDDQDTCPSLYNPGQEPWYCPTP